MKQQHDFCKLGLAVLETEARAINELAARIDENFYKACQVLLNCQGRIVVMGLGKSGHIAGKIAATMASTGSPAFFVHAGEASHGDMGMITKNDVVLALSNSGRTQEIVSILPLMKRLGVPLISLTGNQESELAKAAAVNLDVSVHSEACPLGLAPTSSTTAMLAMGDALAIALLETRGFTSEDFALSHPGGNLGRRLLLKIDDLYHSGDAVPTVKPNTLLRDALVEVTKKRFGCTAIIDEQNVILGVFTDGDLRRALDQGINIHDLEISQVMTKGCKTIQLGMLAAEALKIMEDNKITTLLIADDNNHLIGILHMHDLLTAGVV